MRTVKSLRAALAKFPDDALCYAYEGEVVGVVVQAAPGTPDRRLSELGAIIATSRDEPDGEVHLRDQDGAVFVFPDSDVPAMG